MKYRFITMLWVLIMVIMMFGCQTTGQQTKEAGKFVLRMAIKTAAFAVAVENPQIITPGIIACHTILGEQATEDIIRNEVDKILFAYQNDKFSLPPTVSLEDIIEFVQLMGIQLPTPEIKTFNLDKLDLKYVKFVARAVLQGLETAQRNK